MRRNGENLLVQRDIRAIIMHSGTGAWRIHNTQGISSVYEFQNHREHQLLDYLSMAIKGAGVALEPTIGDEMRLSE